VPSTRRPGPPPAGRLLDEVPERVAKYQVGEAYRLPLWELVYHDCVVAQWYWGDYNNKLPKIWRKRDLFNALYGTPPMYMLNLKQWAEMKDKFAASYRVAEPVARATGYSEMTDHRILTPDRHVHQTVFANGVMIRYLDFNDAFVSLTHGAGHPSDTIAALLTSAELTGRSGRDLITATVLAYEVFCKIADVFDYLGNGIDHSTITGIAAPASSIFSPLKFSMNLTGA